ncbi:hypothetical protein RCL_jg21243.t1 [Rhizophagus clarus]|uniref:Uncharacterized protein n=1 Tax=Rhizophagus clarus TaxID=94130 RepID=A0A8H3QV90_9GLOM|nr:hypothetical protein RCL_jg21243.t1 [Rhizophagus clarus]
MIVNATKRDFLKNWSIIGINPHIIQTIFDIIPAAMKFVMSSCGIPNFIYTRRQKKNRQLKTQAMKMIS